MSPELENDYAQQENDPSIVLRSQIETRRAVGYHSAANTSQEITGREKMEETRNRSFTLNMNKLNINKVNTQLHSDQVSVHEQSVLDQPELMNLVEGDNDDYQQQMAVDMADQLKLPKSSSRSKLRMATTGKPELLEGAAADHDRKETSYQVRGDEEEKQ